MKIHGSVHQIESTYGGSYLNVRENGPGIIGVWGCAVSSPTVLMIRNNTWTVFVFDDERWMDEELPGLVEAVRPDRVLSLPSLEVVDVDREVRD